MRELTEKEKGQLRGTFLWSTMALPENSEPNSDDHINADSVEADWPDDGFRELYQDYRAFLILVGLNGLDLSGSPWEDETQMTHDFVLTAQHHGTGFWDRGHHLGKALTELAQNFGHSGNWEICATDADGVKWWASA